MTLKYLITGATGGLGSQVLAYLSKHLPSSEYAAASSNEASRAQFEGAGIAFRVANFDDPETLDAAFADVENVYFVSTNTFDNERRKVQHRNVVEAAKRTGVKHVWYTSLAFGGLRSDSKVSVQQAHLETEKMLKESGVTYTSIREGIYGDAFPLFLQWYPSTETIVMPQDGVITYTSREELGEANAKLLLKGGHENEIVLLTANEPLRGADIIKMINETTGRNVKLQLVSPEEYVKYHTENDIGKKPESFWRSRISWFEGIAKGDAIFAVTDFWGPMYDQYSYGKLRLRQTINEYCYELEIKRGQNIADAAARIDTLERFVFSSLPGIKSIAGGKYQHVYHFDTKAEVGRYIQESLPELQAKTSQLLLGEYATNWRMWRLRRPNKQEDGTYAFLLPGDSKALTPFVVPRKDTGHFVRALVMLPPGKLLLGYGSLPSHEEYVRLWAQVLKVGDIKIKHVTIDEAATFEGGPHALELAEQIASVLQLDLSSEYILHPSQIPKEIGCPTTSLEDYMKSEDFSLMLSL